MAEMDKEQQSGGLTRRGFLKASAAAVAAGGALNFVWDAEKAAAYEGNPAYSIYPTTCPYCSASCGQRVVVEKATNKVVDIYGDFESPWNGGGLCAKGAGSHQLVTNPRRIGAFANHPENATFSYDPAYTDGIAYKRIGNGTWSKMQLDAAMAEIAGRLKTARDADTAGFDPANAKYNSKGVAFFGCSHMNTETNYLYRKTVALFGTSNTEHQARI